MVDRMLIISGDWIIAHKFNEYFASITIKFNNVENTGSEITMPETFAQFMPPSNENVMFLPEYNVSEIINQLQNGQSSDLGNKKYLQFSLLF